MQQQLGLPHEGVQHVLELFMKSSSFSRYLLDDVLPKVVFNNRKIVDENLDNVLEECETLMVSLKTFRQLSRFLNLGEAISNSTQNIHEKCLNENALVPIKLIESFQIMGDMLKANKDFKQFQLYYCELCDDSSHSVNEVKEHFASERHTSALLSTSESFLTYQCKSCGLFIMASQSLVNHIADDEFHSIIDAAFKKLKLSATDTDINVCNKPSGFNSQLSIDAQDTSESLKSECTNRNDEAAEGGSNEELNSNNEDNNSQLSTFYKDKWSMTDVFVEINDKMLTGKIKYCHYCRPCNQVKTSAQEWYFHKQSQEHKKCTEGIKNYQEKCFNCSFHIFGRKPALNAYLRYHKEVNHKTNSDQLESKQNKSTNKRSEDHKLTERRFNSWKNRSYFKAKKFESVKNNLKREQRSTEDLSNFEDQSSDEPEMLLNKTYEVRPSEKHEVRPSEKHEVRPSEKHEVLSPIKNYASLSLYREVIALQKRRLETNVYSPLGACLPCFDIISDEYDWIVHVKQFHNVNMGFIEETCKTCKISIYGPADVITKEIWNVKEHHDLDKLLN